MDEGSLKHHSYLIERERETSLKKLKKELAEKFNFNIQANPDFFVYDAETLSIDEAREIKANCQTRPFGEKKVIVISVNFLGVEAQNALLKTLEEPPSDTYIFIIMPNATSLLPTVKSRLMSLVLGANKIEQNGNALEFLEANSEDRFKILNSFMTRDSETKKSDLIDFLDNLEREISKDNRAKRKFAGALQELLELKSYLYKPSPPIKMIGEYLALRLPRV